MFQTAILICLYVLYALHLNLSFHSFLILTNLRISTTQSLESFHQLIEDFAAVVCVPTNNHHCSQKDSYPFANMSQETKIIDTRLIKSG
jgi:hypothetical protein